MRAFYWDRADLPSIPTKIITQARRLRALLPPLPPVGIVEDMETTVALRLGPETIPARRPGYVGRSPIPLNSRIYSMLDREVAAYQNGYAEGFVDSVMLQGAQHP